jgi:hypothetical protein
MPYVAGYKPLKNYQRTVLPDAILDHLTANPALLSLIAADTEVVPDVPSINDILSSLVEPPFSRVREDRRIAEGRPVYGRQPMDYLKREASNQSLGAAGEVFIINFERARLISNGREVLADRIEQISTTVGDQAGFDIRSFELDGNDRFIEAKTTKYGIDTPFYVSANELRFCETHQDQYYLYRVFQLRDNPHLFTLKGNIRDHTQLAPISYLARF